MDSERDPNSSPDDWTPPKIDLAPLPRPADCTECGRPYTFRTASRPGLCMACVGIAVDAELDAFARAARDRR